MSTTSYIVFLSGALSTPEKVQEIAHLSLPPAVQPVHEDKEDDADYEGDDTHEAPVTGCCVVDRAARDHLVGWAQSTGERIKPIIPLIPTEPASISKAFHAGYPVPYFIYSAPANHTFLANLLGYDQPPSLQRASIRGYQIKSWGSYKALINGVPDSIVNGTVYMARSEAEVVKLAEWMGFAYEAEKCDIVLTNGESIAGNAFVYCWEPSELED